MALVNHAKKEINAKIVYFGPAGSGKNTALTYIYSRIKPSLRGELKSVAAGADNLLFFDFSPFESPLLNGYRFRLHIYSLTGVVTNPATWKMTLKGTDGIMIMINPDAGHTEENIECVLQLRDFLSAYGVDLHEKPAVLQLNNFTGNTLQADAVDSTARLDLSALAVCNCNAATGAGLLDGLTTLSRQVLDLVKVDEQDGLRETGQTEAPDHDEDFDSVAPSSSASPETRQAAAVPDITVEATETSHITLLTGDICVDGTAVRIPLEIVNGGEKNRMVISVSVAAA